MDKIQIGLLGGIMFLSSCSTVKNVTEISEIDGEWNIVKVNGHPFPPNRIRNFPLLGLTQNPAESTETAGATE